MSNGTTKGVLTRPDCLGGFVRNNDDAWIFAVPFVEVSSRKKRNSHSTEVAGADETSICHRHLSFGDGMIRPYQSIHAHISGKRHHTCHCSGPHIGEGTQSLESSIDHRVTS